MIWFYLAGFFALGWLAAMPAAWTCDVLDWDDAYVCAVFAGVACGLLSILCGMAGFVYLIVKAV